MSLINQVLKDLEKRHATRADVRGLPASVRPLPDQGGRRAGWLFAAAGVVLVAIAAVWWFVLRPVPTSPPVPPPQPLADSPPSPISQPAAGPDRSLAAAPEPAAAAAPAPPVAATEPAQTAADTPARLGRPEGEEQGGAVAPAAVPAPGSTDTASVETKPTPPEPAPSKAVAAKPPAPPTPAHPRAEPVDRPAEQGGPPASEAAGSIDKQMRPQSPSARAESEFRRGMSLLRQGRAQEAQAAWHAALEADPSHEQARQALLGALLEKGRRDEAEALLRDGLQANPRQVNLAMLLARLQVDRGAQQEALETLLASLSNAQWSPDYLAMTAAVLARASRHREAAELYDAALRIGPNNAVWTMGLGLALRADGRPQEALAAFERARDLRALNPDLQAYVERQIRELK